MVNINVKIVFLCLLLLSFTSVYGGRIRFERLGFSDGYYGGWMVTDEPLSKKERVEIRHKYHDVAVSISPKMFCNMEQYFIDHPYQEKADTNLMLGIFEREEGKQLIFSVSLGESTYEKYLATALSSLTLVAKQEDSSSIKIITMVLSSAHP